LAIAIKLFRSNTHLWFEDLMTSWFKNWTEEINLGSYLQQ
jgi:hypothetical protein